MEPTVRTVASKIADVDDDAVGPSICNTGGGEVHELSGRQQDSRIRIRYDVSDLAACEMTVQWSQIERPLENRALGDDLFRTVRHQHRHTAPLAEAGLLCQEVHDPVRRRRNFSEGHGRATVGDERDRPGGSFRA